MSKLVKYSRRFFRSLLPKLTVGDIEFLRAHLSKQEQILFYRMAGADQKHCLNTAYTVEELTSRNSKINHKMLIKVALLHDIGKANWIPPLRFRVYTALFDLLFPFMVGFFAKRGKKVKASKLSKALYIKYGLFCFSI